MKLKSEREVTQSCPTLSDPMDCSPPGSSIHGVFQARVLECGAIAFSDIDIDIIILFSQQTRLFVAHFTGEEIIQLAKDNTVWLLCYKTFQHNQHPVFTPPFLENRNVRPWALRGVNHLMWFSSLSQNQWAHLTNGPSDKLVVTACVFSCVNISPMCKNMEWLHHF